jgi:hypothetical protein
VHLLIRLGPAQWVSSPLSRMPPPSFPQTEITKDQSDSRATMRNSFSVVSSGASQEKGVGLLRAGLIT